MTRVGKLLNKHLIISVVFTLTVIWLAISWGVYQAEHSAPDANIRTFGDGAWWGIVTILTVGYGDKVPVTPQGRVLAGLLMACGVALVGIITAKISSYFLEQALREGRGIVDTSRLKNHFIVCGWKEEMHDLLLNILDFNPGLESADLVVIANLENAAVDAMKAHPRLKNLKVIVGEYFHDVNLRRAAPEKARKVLILADRTPQANGQAPTVTEVDARTIMTAMNLSNIARGTLVAAEILDSKMDQYLKLASVSEIIYSREYSRLLLGNASGGTGVTNIIFDLLDPRTPTVISTLPVPESFHSQKYAALKQELERARRDIVVIGILENTGNSHSIKELALRKAQKTPDVGKLVQNLRSVKELRCNHPVFNPGADYVIPEGAMAIVIENRDQEQKNESSRAA